METKMSRSSDLAPANLLRWDVTSALAREALNTESVSVPVPLRRGGKVRQFSLSLDPAETASTMC